MAKSASAPVLPAAERALAEAPIRPSPSAGWRSSLVPLGAYSYIPNNGSNESTQPLRLSTRLPSIGSKQPSEGDSMELEYARQKLLTSTSIPAMYTVNYSTSVSQVRCVKTSHGRRPQLEFARPKRRRPKTRTGADDTMPAISRGKAQQSPAGNRTTPLPSPKRASRKQARAATASGGSRRGLSDVAEKAGTMNARMVIKVRSILHTQAEKKKKKRPPKVPDQSISLRNLDVYLKVPAESCKEVHALAGDSTSMRDCLSLMVVPSKTVKETMPPLPEGMHCAGPVIDVRPQHGRLISISPGSPVVLTMPHILAELSTIELRTYAAGLKLTVSEADQWKAREDSRKRKQQALIAFGRQHREAQNSQRMSLAKLVEQQKRALMRAKQANKRRESMALALRKSMAIDAHLEDATPRDGLRTPESSGPESPASSQDKKGKKRKTRKKSTLGAKGRKNKRRSVSPTSRRGSSQQRKNHKR